MEVRELVINYKRRKRFPDAIQTATAAAAAMRKCLPNNSREHFCALYLDGSHKPINYAVISSGLANASQIHPRELFQPAILAGACAVICFHNHPSGSTTPSREDREVTKRLVDAGKLLSIPVLDHIILTDTEHYSFLENGAF